MSNEEKRYNVTPEIFERANIKGSPENMSAWLDSLDEEHLSDWYLIATRDRDKNSIVELEQAMIVTLALFSYELDEVELGLSDSKVKELVNRFLLNIIIHKGVAEDMYIVTGELSLIKDSVVELTEKGRLMAVALFEEDVKKIYGS